MTPSRDYTVNATSSFPSHPDLYSPAPKPLALGVSISGSCIQVVYTTSSFPGPTWTSFTNVPPALYRIGNASAGLEPLRPVLKCKVSASSESTAPRSGVRMDAHAPHRVHLACHPSPLSLIKPSWGHTPPSPSPSPRALPSIPDSSTSLNHERNARLRRRTWAVPMKCYVPRWALELSRTLGASSHCT